MTVARSTIVPQSPIQELTRRALFQRTGLGLVAAAAAIGPVDRVWAQAATAAATPEARDAVYEFTVGSFACYAVSDGVATFPDPTQLLFTNAPADELASALAEYDAPDPWSEWLSPFTPLLIDIGRERVLIDTGIGAVLGPATGQLLPNLAAAGFGPDDIDVVVLTHGHPDHIGGSVDGTGLPAFPNARYVMARADWDFWTDEAQITTHIPPSELRDLQVNVARASLPPLADRIDLIEDGAEIAPGVQAISAPGHSPGHIVLTIASGGEQLLYGADTVLHPIHLEHPDWLTIFDTHPEPTVSTRRMVLDLAATENILMMAYHIPFPGLGRVATAGEVWRWEPLVAAS